MLKSNNLSLLILLTLLIACKGGNDAPMPTTDEAVAPTETPLVITLPSAVFTETSKVAQGAASPVILDRLIGLIDATPENEVIHISIFGFDHDGLIEALKRANKRGVYLHLMIDMSREETIEQNPKTINELRASLKGNYEIVIVQNDASSIAINHNKFALFSEVTTNSGKKENIVFQTSHNFTLADSKKIQDAVTLSDKGLYNAFLLYWNDMKEKASKDMKYYKYREYNDPVGGIEAYFLPKRRGGAVYGDDTIIEILDKIDKPSAATIQLGMSDWTDTRLNIVEKLGELLTEGARVEIIVKSSIGEQILDGLRELEKKGAYLKVYNLTDSTKPKVNIHAKFMLIKGSWEGREGTLLMTGSHNFTQNALRNNNETILLFKNHTLFGAYQAWFESLREVPGL